MNNLLVEQVLRCLQDTNSIDPTIRKQAEEMLMSSETKMDFVRSMFSVALNCDVPAYSRMAAVLALKNCIRRRWQPDAAAGSTVEGGIALENREFLKTHLVSAMLSSEPLIRRQWIDVIACISKHDFPGQWPSLVAELKQPFASKNYQSISAVLETCALLFKHYETDMKSDKLWLEIKFVLDNMASDITGLMQSIMVDLGQAGQDDAQWLGMLECLILICQIFYSLNAQDLPEFFEDNMSLWMNSFGQMLNFTREQFPLAKPAGISDLLERLKAQVVDDVTLYAENYGEEFDPYAVGFVSLVWNLLVRATLAERDDQLVINGLRFLTVAVAKDAWNKPFAAEDIIKQTCHEIVLKNMELRSSDVDLFESAPEEYAEQDLTGSDFETRRRSARELIKALCVSFEPQVMSILSDQVQSLLNGYSTNPDINWTQMDAAIYLVIAIGSRGHTVRQGVTKVSNLFDASFFFQAVLNHELQKNQGVPVLKADVLKYLITFRSIFDKAVMLSYLPGVVCFLIHPNPVVRIYSAHLIECLLTTRDNSTPPVKLYKNDELAPYLANAIESLVQSSTMEGTEECVYIVRCMLQLLAAYRDQASTTVLATLFQMFQNKLLSVMKAPRKPMFNHCVFEILCLLLQIVGRRNGNAFEEMENSLLVPFQEILMKDMSDFVPYVFQLMSLMLNLRVGRAKEIPEPYLMFYPFLLSDQLWECGGYVPAIVRLLQAYFRLDAAALLGQEQFKAVFNIFNRLLMVKNREQYAVDLMTTVVRSLVAEQFRPYCEPVLKAILNRLHTMKLTPPAVGGSNDSARSLMKAEKLPSLFVNFFCLLLRKFRAVDLEQIVNNIQPSLFAMLLEKVVVPQLATVPKSREDVNARVMGLLELIVDYPPVVSGELRSLWCPLASGMVGLIGGDGELRKEDAEDVVELPDVKQGFDAAYSALIYSELRSADRGEDLNILASAGLNRFSREHPNEFKRFKEEVPAALREKLEHYAKF